MDLKRKTAESRRKAVKEIEKRVRDLMTNNPSISLDKLVSITGFSEYILQRIYMKIRRENSKKAV